MTTSWGRKVGPEGSADARVMIVGEAPGANEIVTGRPFVGAAGNLLRESLLKHGISSRDVFFTNLCKYRPPANELKAWFQGCTPKPDSPVMEGMLELSEEIEAVKPNLIVACGNFPLWALTAGLTKTSREGPTGVSDWRGSIVEGNGLAGGRKILATMHPASILRQMTMKPLFNLDIGRIKTEMQFPEIRRRPRRIIMEPKGVDRLELQRRYLDHPESLAFDIEYTPKNGNLICISFSVDPEEAFTMSCTSGSDVQFIREMLTSGKPLTAQNGIFDCSILEYWYSIPCLEHLKHDTMLAQHSAYIELPKDLGTLCSIYTDQPCYWTVLGDKHWSGPRSESWLETTMRYNAIDAYVTKEIELQQRADELLDPHVSKTFDFEMSLHAPLWSMSRKGVPVDESLMSALKVELSTREDALMAKLTELTGREINVKSGVAVAKLLFTDLKLKATAFTDKGKPKTDDKTLVDVARRATPEAREIVDTIREIRDCRDLKSKFLDIQVDPDGRLRCHYNIGGTTTGRLASRKFFPTGSGGNLQNIPKDPRIRRVFVPERGKVFFYNDLKSAESHVVAQLTGDPLMLQLHEPGAKPHETTAAMIFGIPMESVGKDSVERTLGKMARHACNYMMGWMRFMQNVNAKSLETGVFINAAQSKQIVGGYQRMHPRLPEWWRRVEDDLRRKGVLYNLLGRPRVFFDRVEASLPNAVAFVPQSTVGDLLNLALVRVHADEELRSYGVECLLQVHDAIGGQVNERDVEPAMRRMKELMSIPLHSDTTGQDFIIPVDIAVGTSWADVKTIEV